jgi:hypothetical protein
VDRRLGDPTGGWMWWPRRKICCQESNHGITRCRHWTVTDVRVITDRQNDCLTEVDWFIFYILSTMFFNSYFERRSVSPLPLKLYLNAYNGKQCLYILYKHFFDSVLYFILFFSPRRKASRSVRVSSFFICSCSVYPSGCLNVIPMLFVSCPLFHATGKHQNTLCSSLIFFPFLLLCSLF